MIRKQKIGIWLVMSCVCLMNGSAVARLSAQTADGSNPTAEPLRTELRLLSPREGRPQTGRLLWIGSVVGMGAATVVDAHSSWRKDELNPLLAGSAGKFGMRGVAIKGALNSAWVVSQMMVLRKTRAHRTFAIVNFALAAFYTASAFHNYGGGRTR